MTDAARFRLGALGFLFFIVIPLVLCLKRRGETDRRTVLSIIGMWIVWNLVHAPIHEFSHMLGGWLAGQHVRDYRLIQHFWEGDFVRAYVSWGPSSQAQYLVSTPAPYVIDGLMILLGLLAFRWRRRAFRPIVGAAFLVLTFLRPLYDIATNYAADTLLGGAGDVGFLLYGYPPIGVHIWAWLQMFLAAAGATFEIVNTRKEHSAISARNGAAAGAS